MLRPQSFPIRNVNLTSLPIARIVLILKVELFFADYRRKTLAEFRGSTSV